jgi:hypothetical protein
LQLRPDISITIVGMPYRLNEVLRRLRGAGDVIGVDQRDFEIDGEVALPEGDHLILLEALAAGPAGVLVDQDQASLITHLSSLDAPCWVTTGVGRVLPPELFAEIRERSVEATPEEHGGYDDGDLFDLLGATGSDRSRRRERPVVFLGADQINMVVGPRGRAVPELALRRAECRAPAELLGFARLR